MKVKNIEPRFVILLSFSLCIITMFCTVALKKVKYTTLEPGSITMGRQETGIIVRNETIHYAQDIGQLQYLVSEGDAVEAGRPLVRAFRTGFSAISMDAVYQIQGNLLKYQLDKTTDRTDTVFLQLQEQIDTVRENIAVALISDDIDEVYWADSAYRRILQDRRAYLDQRFADDAYVQQLQQREQIALQQVSDFTQDIPADADGLVSFFYDGCESITVDTVVDMTYEAITSTLQSRDGVRRMTNQGYTPFFKLVQEDRWMFVAFSKAAGPYQADQLYEVVFDGFEDKTYLARFLEQKKDGKRYILYFECKQQSLGPLLNQRAAVGSAGRRVEGLRVDQGAVYTIRGQEGVWLMPEGLPKTFVPVTVTAHSGGFVIVEQKEGTELLKPGVRVRTR